MPRRMTKEGRALTGGSGSGSGSGSGPPPPGPPPPMSGSGSGSGSGPPPPPPMGSGSGSGSGPPPPPPMSGSGSGMVLLPSYYYGPPPPPMGSGSGSGSGPPPTCAEIIAFADLDGDGKIVLEEWTAAGNCHSEEEFEQLDEMTNNDGELDEDDCLELAADVVADLGDVALNPACSGPVGAEA